MRYSIDTSALIEAWHRAYPIDVVPALWDGFDELITSGALRATEEVVLEIERKEDALHEWIAARPRLSVAIDSAIQPVVKQVLTSHPKLLDTRKNRSGGDPFVIALGKITGCTVVTNERPTNSTARPNIPDVCAAYGVRYVNVLGLIREQGWVFYRRS
jgi:hypothetical protein